MLTELDHKILQTVLQERKPISSKKLAMLCGAAINTIRKEIALLNQEIESQGLFIEMKSSVGVYPVILEPERAFPYISQLRIFYNRSLHVGKQYSARVYALLWRCLSAESGLTIEKLCDEFFSSRSTILRELSGVREILREFHLRLKNHRSNQGLTVEGSEWNIRQCLVHQHKIYRILTDGSDMGEYAGEHSFRFLFFMDEPTYDDIHNLVSHHLEEQSWFSFPIIHIPKLSNMLLLCLSRRKNAKDLSFSVEQLAFVDRTPEYELIKALYLKLPPRFQECLGEMELASLTMLLLGFGEQMGGREEYFEETKDLISYLIDYSGLDPEDFDQFFRENFSCYLSRLDSRRIFGLWNDLEPIGQIRHVGLSSANLCLAFARFYKERHGVILHPGDTMGCFYILNRVIVHNHHRYWAQKILVVSEYGLECARAMASRLLAQHGTDIKEIEAISYGELSRRISEGWTLLVSDLSEKKILRYLPHCSIPVLTIEFRLFEERSGQLDAYLLQIKQQAQLKIIHSESFCRTDLNSKEEVFAFLGKKLDNNADLAGMRPLSSYLLENDTLMDMERENGVVFLPVFTARTCKPRITVLLNKAPLLWNHQRAQIFVCCVYNNSLHDGRVMTSILHRFVYMTPETKQKLLQSSVASPLLALYPDE